MNNVKPYYMDQKGWGADEYYGLHRYLHRVFLHYDRKKEEIESMDISKMSEETKVLIYCILEYYHLNDLFQMENLNMLKKCTPLKKPLVLGNHKIKGDNIYNHMNVIL